MRPLFFCTLLLSLFAQPARAKEYSAERFDSEVEVLRGGTLRVTETVRLRFEEGTFTEFFREIPTRMTDGIDVVSAAMDGAVFTRGEGPGQVDVRSRSRVRVTWRFPPVSESSHVFTLSYVVRGAIRQEADADVLAWRAMPSQHRYRIGAGTTLITLPRAPSAEPRIETHNGSFTADVEDTRVRIEASDVRANGWVEAHVRAPRGSIIDGPPNWQRRALQVRSDSSTWIVLSGLVLVGGLVVLFGVRQGYEVPPRDIPAGAPSGAIPEALAPAIAGALLTNGSPQTEHAMATLFALAERGEITIEEQPRSFGQSSFAVTRSGTGRALVPHESRLLEILFGAGSRAEASISLSRGRGRLVRHFGRFRAAVREEMASAGLLDEGRMSVRRRFRRVALGSFIAAAAAACLAGFLATDRFGQWPMLVPLACAVVGLAALISYAAHTPLSNDAARRLQSWRAFRAHLRNIAKDSGAPVSEASLRQWLPYVVAAGLAASWATYIKRHRGLAPPWFRALGNNDNSAAAFATFVNTGGSGAGGGGTAGGGGMAAGGGASGAR